jgi:crossover junction endodeoxyribonuclease RuvC
MTERSARPARRVLGVDPGSIRCGWGVVESQGARVVRISSGVIDAGRGDLAVRLGRIRDGLRDAASVHGPTEAAIEALFFHRNAQSALKLGEARGVAILALHDAGLPVAEYEPAFVKKSVVGSGRADKDQVALMVQAMLGYRTPAARDESDALAIAICHLHQNPLLARSTL